MLPILPRLFAIGLLPWLIINCMGGDSDQPRPPDAANAPNETEAQIIDHVWQAMEVEPYPVWIYRDTWTPDRNGRTWGDVGRRSNAPCSGRYGTEFCISGVWDRGRIAVLRMAPETVDQFNATYRPPEPVGRDWFTLRRFAGLLIYERMHQLGWPYEMTDARRKAEADYRARVDWTWIETRDDPHEAAAPGGGSITPD